MPRQSGFTLVELITVMVILGVVAAIGSEFVVHSVNGYSQQQNRFALSSDSRRVFTSINRQLQNALPNSLRISNDGQCIEFMPVVGGAIYTQALALLSNGLSPSSTVSVLGLEVDGAGSAFVAIAPMQAAEVYQSNSPVLAALANPLIAGSSTTAITLSGPHRFARNSPSQRLFLVASPSMLCLQNGRLNQFYNYPGPSPSMPSGLAGAEMLAANLAANGEVFSLSQGAENRNAELVIRLVFSAGKESLLADSKVRLYNVP